MRVRATHVALLDRQIIGDDALERVSVLVAPILPVGLRVGAVGDLAQRLLGHDAGLLGTEHRRRAQQHPPGGTAMTILHGPCAIDLAASGEAQPVAETGHPIVPFEMVGLARRQGERGDGLLR